MGIKPGSYEAYCLDQAVWYLGTRITTELDKVGQKRDGKQIANEAARKRLLDKFLGTSKNQPQQYADPAALFAQRYGPK